MQLTNGTTVTLNGRYSVKFYPNGGTAKLQMKDGDEPWSDIAGANADGAVKIKTFEFSGDIRAVLANGANIYVDQITG